MVGTTKMPGVEGQRKLEGGPISDERRPEPAGEGVPAPLVPRPQRRSIARAVLRSLLTVAVLVVVYYAVPLNRTFGPGSVITLVVALAFLVVLVALQLRSILRSPVPALRAVESLALTVPLFLLLFAIAYDVLSTTDSSAFSQRLTRTDSLYFVVTVFATVGFGDITAVSEAARVLVTIQMVADLLVLGLVIRAVASAVQRSSRSRSREPR